MKRKKIPFNSKTRSRKIKAESMIDEDQLDKLMYVGVHRAGFTKLFLGYAMQIVRYDEYDDHIVAYFPEEMGLKPLYFSYNSDTDFVLTYVDEL